MKKERLLEALGESILNGIVAFLIIYGSMSMSGGLSLIEAIKPAFLIGLIRFASYLAHTLEYVELPDMDNYSKKDKAKNALTHLFRFIKVGK